MPQEPNSPSGPSAGTTSDTRLQSDDTRQPQGPLNDESTNDGSNPGDSTLQATNGKVVKASDDPSFQAL